MLFSSRSVLLALATGLAVDGLALPNGLKVRTPPREPALPAPKVLPKRQDYGFSDLSDLVSYDDALYDSNPSNIQIAQVNITNVAVNDDQVVIQQIQQTLIQASSDNSQLDQKRIDSYASSSSEETVLLVVQEVQIIQQVSVGGNSYDYEYYAYDYYAYANDGNGNIQTRSVFVQSAITANAGLGIASTIMISASETLSITNSNLGTGGLLGTGAANTGALGTGAAKGTGAAAAGTGKAQVTGAGAAGTGKGAGAGAAATGGAAAATGTGAAAAKVTVTTTVTVTDKAPTWTSYAADPAATVSKILNNLGVL